MAWREQIRPATFRGTPFGVTGDDKEGGRRTVVHEFPQREEVYVEDLGAATTRFTVQAFVLGPDYMAKRDALEQSLSEPGPGTLVHPWYGEVTVSQFAPYKVKHTAQDGGMCVFTLSFARDAEPSSPNAAVNTRIRSLDKAGLAGLLSCAALDAAFVVAGQTAYVVEQAYQAVTDAVTRVQAVLGMGGGDVNRIAGLLGAATGYDFLPWVSVGQRLWGVFQDMGVSTGISEAQLAGNWQTLAARDTSVLVAERPGSTRSRVAANEAAVNAFTRHIAVAESARSLALAVPESRAQARDLREGFIDALDAVLADLGDAAALPASALQDAGQAVSHADALYTALVETRATTLAALAEAARSAPEVVNYTPAAVLPSLALCYRLSGDIALDADLVARNGVIHPGFVPVETLEVLTHV